MSDITNLPNSFFESNVFTEHCAPCEQSGTECEKKIPVGTDGEISCQQALNLRAQMSDATVLAGWHDGTWDLAHSER